MGRIIKRKNRSILMVLLVLFVLIIAGYYLLPLDVGQTDYATKNELFDLNASPPSGRSRWYSQSFVVDKAHLDGLTARVSCSGIGFANTKVSIYLVANDKIGTWENKAYNEEGTYIAKATWTVVKGAFFPILLSTDVDCTVGTRYYMVIKGVASSNSCLSCDNIYVLGSSVGTNYADGAQSRIAIVPGAWQTQSRDLYFIAATSDSAEDEPPIVSFTPADGNTLEKGAAIQFSSQSYDPENSAVTHAWDFNEDGVTDSTSRTPTWTFDVAGTAHVTLKVTDASGLSTTKTHTYTISGGGGPGPDTYYINVHVIDTSNNDLQGVSCTIGDETHTTDVNGEGVSFLRANGAYTLSCSLTGYQDTSTDITVNGADQSVAVIMSSGGSTGPFDVSIIVDDGENVIQGAKVTLSRGSGDSIIKYSSLTNANGKAIFTDVEAGDYQVYITYQSASTGGMLSVNGNIVDKRYSLTLVPDFLMYVYLIIAVVAIIIGFLILFLAPLGIAEKVIILLTCVGIAIIFLLIYFGIIVLG